MSAEDIGHQSAAPLPYPDSGVKGVLAQLHSLPALAQERFFVQSEDDVAHAISHDFADRNPAMSARHGIRLWQRRVAQSAATACVITAVVAPWVLLLFLLALTHGHRAGVFRSGDVRSAPSQTEPTPPCFGVVRRAAAHLKRASPGLSRRGRSSVAWCAAYPRWTIRRNSSARTSRRTRI